MGGQNHIIRHLPKQLIMIEAALAIPDIRYDSHEVLFCFQKGYYFSSFWRGQRGGLGGGEWGGDGGGVVLGEEEY